MNLLIFFLIIFADLPNQMICSKPRDLTHGNNIQTLNYFEPGNYILLPKDYGYADNIIVEMWGPGAGGSSQGNYSCENCNIYFGCLLTRWSYTGGNSGAYFKASIFTKRKPFNLTISAGGTTCPELDSYSNLPCWKTTCTGISTMQTIFYNDETYLSIGSGQDLSINSSNIEYIMSYSYGNPGNGPDYFVAYTYGGNSINTLNGLNNNVGQGSASPSWYMAQGQSGGIVIYVSVPFSQSPTVTITPSITPSIMPLSPTKSISLTSSNSFSTSQTPSISSTPILLTPVTTEATSDTFKINEDITIIILYVVIPFGSLLLFVALLIYVKKREMC